MKSPFVTTQLTLLMKLVERESGESELAWSRFFELYYPAMLKFAELFCSASEAEDIVQRVLAKLVGILREKRYERRTGKLFRGYLKTLIKNEFIDYRMVEESRGGGRSVPIDLVEIAISQDPAVKLDIEWRMAIRAAATEHVLTRTVLNESMRRAYRLHVLEGMSVQDAADCLGVTRNYVTLAKSRINQRIAALEAVYVKE